MSATFPAPARYRIAACCALLLTSSVASAQDVKYVPEPVESAKVKDVGWDGTLSLGASVSMSQSSKVVGRADGTSFSLGFKMLSGLDYIKGEHEWRNALTVGETFTRTPTVTEFIKTNDALSLDSLYLYHIKPAPWIGPFARVQLDTSVFAGHDVRAETTDYLIARLDSSTERRRGTILRLSDPFSPLALRQTLGVFAQPLQRPYLKIELKAGFRAAETLAEGQLALKDDGDTPAIEVIELKDVMQGGPAFGIIIGGELSEKRVTYNGVAEAMIPVLNDLPDADTRDAGELTNLNFELNISFKLVTWASLDYQFKAIKEPQLLDDFQVQNNLLLTFSWSLLESQQKKAAK